MSAIDGPPTTTRPAAYWTAAPPPMVPVAAVDLDTITGQRALVRLDTHSWLADVVIAAELAAETNTINVCTEEEWWSAQRENRAPAATAHAAETVWIETRAAGHRPPPQTGVYDWFTRVEPNEADHPSPRPPRPARNAVTLLGQRLIVMTAAGYDEDYRALSEPHHVPDGDITVDACRTQDWYDARATGSTPPVTQLSLPLVWAD